MTVVYGDSKIDERAEEITKSLEEVDNAFCKNLDYKGLKDIKRAVEHALAEINFAQSTLTEKTFRNH